MTQVEELTGFPECLDGRVKTLHPEVHAGILADTRNPDHVQQLAELGIEPFDLVVVNLYPFRETVPSGASQDECIEQIDIGGPSMVRAAAKNHASVAIVTSPTAYADGPRGGRRPAASRSTQRQALAAEAFVHTATYDIAVASWMGSVVADTSDGTGFPAWVGATWTSASALRYGENPHQRAALVCQRFQPRPGLAQAEQLHGKEMSYNNYLDTDAAVRAAHDHGDQPTVAIVKHDNPCGIAVGAGHRRGAPQGARVRPAVGLRRRHRDQPRGDGRRWPSRSRTSSPRWWSRPPSRLRRWRSSRRRRTCACSSSARRRARWRRDPADLRRAAHAVRDAVDAVVEGDEA